MTTLARRSAAVLLLAVAGLLAPASPAAADGALAPLPEEAVRAHGPIALSGSVDVTERYEIELRLAVPGAAEPVTVAALPRATAREADRAIAFELATAPCNVPGACAAGSDAPNGRWTVQLVHLLPAEFGGPELLAEGGFDLDVPARTPSDVSAELEGDRSVVVRWSRGTEPDLIGWELDDGAGSTAAVVPGDVCEGAACSAVFEYGPADSGSRSFTIAAARACGTADCEATLSKPATAGPVVLPEKPKASPTVKPSGSPGPSSGPAKVAARGSTGGPARSGFQTFAPSLGLPRLPSQNGGSAPAVAAPLLPDGELDETLGYEDRVEREPVLPEAAGRDGALLTSTDAGLLGDEAVMRGVAAALVLGLSGAHLRTWLARARAEDGDL
jgi:hypothetical protein